jgi:hypothetical protein
MGTRRDLVAFIGHQFQQRARSDYLAKRTLCDVLQRLFGLDNLKAVFHRIGAPVLNDHLNKYVLLVGRQNFGAKRIIVDGIGVDDVDHLDRIGIMPM